MKTSFRASMILAALALVACNGGLVQEWQVTDFRVLAVKSDPAQPTRGQSMQLTLDYADTQDRQVQVFWLLCSTAVTTASVMDAGGGGIQGALGGCTYVSLPGLPVPDLATSVTGMVPSNGGAPDPSGNEAVTLLGFACAGGSIGPPVDGGTTPTCTASNGGTATGWQFQRTIPVYEPTQLNPANNNPQITDVVLIDGFGSHVLAAGGVFPVTACADPSHFQGCTNYTFEVRFADGSRETYQAYDSDGGLTTLTEHLTVGYVTDRGTLAGGFRTDSSADPQSKMDVGYHAPSTTGPAHVWIVAMDGRGGFDFTERTLNVQ